MDSNQNIFHIPPSSSVERLCIQIPDGKALLGLFTLACMKKDHIIPEKSSICKSEFLVNVLCTVIPRKWCNTIIGSSWYMLLILDVQWKFHFVSMRRYAMIIKFVNVHMSKTWTQISKTRNLKENTCIFINFVKTYVVKVDNLLREF